ncbi:proline racemase family protein [Flavobacterium muglaense]|uniref:Proline racemase family protein n=1 Tax=Flavobacterium muglaense TaxID=2764716 RepID=A0A923SGP7_9FLAO|nr:proline racemase family protein [Flavobacterium muglaense]MBC5838399.1 proline racemase family protein [Flavobacterium muglaense]MBC5844934.1 proline racemase family protein [Flavobacterium muglaense]
MTSTYQNILKNTSFSVPENWMTIKTIDMHTGGEPLRVILDGFPKLKGNSILECRREIKENYDYLRTTLMFEPRGHADMYGCVLLPPNSEDADFGILFLHNEGYSTMCGHAIIAISTLSAKMNWISVSEGENVLKIDAPCGRINSFVNIKNGEVYGVKFHCVPSFVVGLDRVVDVPGLGEITYDLAYGGAFYAYVDLRKNNLNLRLSSDEYRSLIQTGMHIKQAIILYDLEILHPFEEDLSFLYGIIFIDEPHDPKNHSRNVCIFAEGEVDRSPTGSGVSGRIAIERTRSNIDYKETLTIESITNSVFNCSLIFEKDYGPFKAVIPQVEGTAHITGMNTFVIDPEDPMKNGFILR